MPAAESDLRGGDPGEDEEPLKSLPFPPLTRAHVMNCAVSSWYPKFRTLTPKTRLVPLPAAFIAYLRADGIHLPPSRRGSTSTAATGHYPSPPSTPPQSAADAPAAADSAVASDSEDDEEASDPSRAWAPTHALIGATIASLGGHALPKLNWSAPKDATWISANNSMDCTSANDVYLLLKSSDFVSHDLEHAFDDCVDNDDPINHTNGVTDPDDNNDAEISLGKSAGIPYHLALRKAVPSLRTSMEFRLFVRRGKLLAACQREPAHYAFLHPHSAYTQRLARRLARFWAERVRAKLADDDDCYVLDVYVPRLPDERPAGAGEWRIPAHAEWAAEVGRGDDEEEAEGSAGESVREQEERLGRVWIIDVNPWAPRTDPLLFSWLELLTMPDPEFTSLSAAHGRNGDDIAAGVSSLSLTGGRSAAAPDGGFAMPFVFRTVAADDPEAYSFSTPLYSAHKLPRDVVEAGMQGGAGIRDFIEQWEKGKWGSDGSSDEE